MIEIIFQCSICGQMTRVQLTDRRAKTVFCSHNNHKQIAKINFDRNNRPNVETFQSVVKQWLEGENNG